MPMSNYAMDKFVSQHFSELEPLDLPSIADEFPEHSAWISAFVMKRIVHNHVQEARVPAAMTLLLRAEAAFEEWELARQTLAELSRAKTFSGYFKARRHLENTVAALYQGYAFAMKALNIKLFQTNDGSTLERLNSVYNKGRHFGPDDLEAGDLHAVWVANDGLHARTKEGPSPQVRS